ncbi:MAG: hypothetical protein WA705_17040 [Candidatus Ozemobacteraceae bacterium]
MKYRFYLEPGTEEPHILLHDVSEVEAEEAFENNQEDRQGEKNARSRIGQTDAGRHLRIIYRVFPKEILIITAYDLVGKALKAFKRRKKK